MPYHLATVPYEIRNAVHVPEIGAGDEARTRYLHLGKVALYRMSYTRILVPTVGIEFLRFRNDLNSGASGRNRTNDTRIFSPLLYLLSYRGMLRKASFAQNTQVRI